MSNFFSSKRKTQEAPETSAVRNNGRDRPDSRPQSSAAAFKSFPQNVDAIKHISQPVNLIPNLLPEEQFAVPQMHQSPRSTIRSVKASSANSAESISREASHLSISSRASSQPGSTLSHAPSIRSIASTSSMTSQRQLPVEPDRTPRRPSTPSFTSFRSSHSSSHMPPPSPLLPSSQFKQEPSDFNFPRPASNAVVEQMFGELLTKTNMKADKRNEMLEWPMDKKWQLVYAEKLNDFRALQKGSGSRHPSGTSNHVRIHGEDGSEIQSSDRMSLNDPPQGYLTPFMNGSITAKKLESLVVAIRTYQISWVKSFIDLQGQVVLGSALNNINRAQHWREPDIPIEYEILKCFKQLFNSRYGAADALEQPKSVHYIAASITSPHLPSRKIISDLLIFITYCKPVPKGHLVTIAALDHLAAIRKELGRFDAWFTSFEATIDGRGKMGSMVGASEEYRSLRGRDMQRALVAREEHSVEQALIEYAQSNLLLINALLQVPEELDVRLHLRSQMESSGVKRILDKLRRLNNVSLNRALSDYEADAENDLAELQESLAHNRLEDLSDPYEVLRAVLLDVEGTRGQDFLISALKHLLLMRYDGETKVRYFQLVDRIITAVAMDSKAIDSDFSTVLGTSVARVVERFSDQDRLQKAIQDANSFREHAQRLNLEKLELEEQISSQQGGVVSQLKASLGRAQDDLQTSRQATQALERRIEEIEREHREKESQTDLQIRELFTMLREARMLEVVEDNSGVLDRHALMEQMDKQLQRTKTIFALEGRAYNGERKPPVRSQAKGFLSVETSAPLAEASNKNAATSPRKSRFEDAADEEVRRHIEDSLAAGVSNLSPYRTQSPKSTRGNIKWSPKDSTGSPRSRTPDVYDNDLTPQAARHQQLLPSPIKSTKTSLAQDIVKTSLPVTLLDQIKARRTDKSAATTDDDSDAEGTTSHRTDSEMSTATSMTSVDGLPRPAKSPKRQANEARRSTVDEMLAEERDVIREASKITISPTRSKAAQISSNAPPPPPPPPPIMGGLRPAAQIGGALAGELPFLKDIGASRLKSAANLPAKAILVPKGSPVAPAGNLSVPPAPPLPPGIPRAPGAPAPPALGGLPAFGSLANKRKEVAFGAKQKTKQVQWENIAFNNLEKTIWGQEPSIGESELSKILQTDGTWQKMEEEFKFATISKKATPKLKEDFGISVLDITAQKNTEIVLRKYAPLAADQTFDERLAILMKRILTFDEDLCSEAFLNELHAALPKPDVQGKLNIHRTSGPEVLATLHKADRFLVELLRIDDHLEDRIRGMQYHARFAEAVQTLRQKAIAVNQACISLQHAPYLRDLLNVALAVGNFLNASGKGGAFGFRLSSLNKFVDTKSAQGTTLLHSLQRIISSRFQQVEQFMLEIEKPVAAHKLNLDEMRKELAELKTDLDNVSDKLNVNFVDLDNLNMDDRYPSVMFPFVKEAKDTISALQDLFRVASASYREVLQLYQEDHRSQSTNEFFGILQQFASSYKLAKKQNEEVQERQESLEKRKRAHEERKRGAQAAREALDADDDGRQIADDLLSKLREGNLRTGRRARKSRRSTSISSPSQQSTQYKPKDLQNSDDPALIAQDLLKELHGEEYQVTTSPTRPQRTSRKFNGSDSARSSLGSPMRPEPRGSLTVSEVILEESSSSSKESGNDTA